MASLTLKIGAVTPALFAAAFAATFAVQAHALQITSLSPQGEVSAVRQVVAKFDESAVTDPAAIALGGLRVAAAQG